MAHFETLLERVLVRVICLYYQTKLPYLALIHHLDEKTTSENTLRHSAARSESKSGGDVHSLEVGSSPTIPSADLPHLTTEVEQELSSDVKLLYRCAKVITTGATAAVLRHVKLGGDRWHTAQSHVLRFYMSQAELTKELRALARYIVAVYVLAVLGIKT